MGKLYFDGNGSGSYLVYQLEQDEELDSISLGMLTNNQIPGLASVVYTQMNSTRLIKYNIRSKVTVKQLFSGYVNKKTLLGVLNGIVDAILQSEEYMLYVDNIIFDLDYIFSDVSTYNTVMICLPVTKSKNSIDLLTFFKSIVINLHLENGDYFTKIINFLNGSLNFSAIEFKKLLDSLSNAKNSQLDNKSQISDGSEYIRSDVGADSMKAVHNVIVQPVYQSNQPAQQQPVVPIEKKSSAVPQTQKKIEQSYAVPPANPPAPATYQSEAQAPVTTPDGKKPTFMWLMMHYSKENKALYDASKNSQKSRKANSPNVSDRFEVPGRQTNNGFAIPGQQESVSSSTPPPKYQVQSQQSFSTHNNQATPQQMNNLLQSKSNICERVVPAGQSASFGETTVLDGGNIGETTVLGESANQSVQKPYLIRIKNNERIDINKPVFKIGKEKSYVDYFISYNTAISRSHATIITREGKYFIIDTNSTNHTYLNGGMIPSNVETPISHGTRIRLANEEFEFKLN